MSRTYTEHKLTDAQLRRLSAVVNQTPGAAKHGVAGAALKRKGLVTDVADFAFGCNDRIATDAGRAALEQARQEGW